MKEPAVSHVFMDHPVIGDYGRGYVDEQGFFHFWAPNSPEYQPSGEPVEEPEPVEQPLHETCVTPMQVDACEDEILLPLLEEDPIVISSDSSSASSSASPSESSAGSGFSWRESASSVDLNGSEFGSDAFDSTSSSSKSATLTSSSEKTEGSSSSSSWAATRRGRGRMFGFFPYSKK